MSTNVINFDNPEEYIQALIRARQTEKDPIKRAKIKEALFWYAYGNGPQSLKSIEAQKPDKL